MTAVPSNFKITCEFQDNRGFRALADINLYVPDISADAAVVSAKYTYVAGVAAALALASNSKLIRVTFAYSFDYAQEPSTETGTYELVIQKARLNGGDGNGGFMRVSIPAPKDTLFLTTADANLVVVNPASTLVTGLQAALAASGDYPTPRLGASFAQFFGGELVQGKPRRRRVLQGA